MTPTQKLIRTVAVLLTDSTPESIRLMGLAIGPANVDHLLLRTQEAWAEAFPGTEFPTGQSGLVDPKA